MEKYKDPAFLFYSESFLIGTMFMSDEEIGQYIKLMCIQHQKGHLPTSLIEKSSPVVQDKFIQDDAGMWFNERLEYEIKRRAKYTESRRRNLESKKNKEAEEKPEEKPDKPKKETVTAWIEEIIPEELQESFIDWARMRTQIKKPITTKATITRNYAKLCKLSKRTDKQIRIIEQSVDRCWQTFYELKEETKPSYMKELPHDEETIKAEPMPDEVREKAKRLGIRIGG